MMDNFNNIETIKKSLSKIIKSKDKFVAIISGEWGSGKTYFWKEFANTLDEDIKYAYISFFGINSIEEIRQQIFFKVSRKGKTVNWLQENILDKIRNVKGAFNIEEDIKLTLDGGLLNLAFSLMGKGDFEKVIICFDDFERLSDKVSLKDVMGLISELKEEKECKVILILNENELENLSQINGKKLSDIFALYKEKIIDYDLNFIPSVEYCFNTVNTQTSFNNKVILDFFIEKDIRNIRVISKSLKHLKEFEFVNKYTITEKTKHKFLMLTLNLFLYKEIHNVTYKKIEEIKGKAFDDFLERERLRKQGIQEQRSKSIEANNNKDYEIYKKYINGSWDDFNIIIFDYLYKHYIDEKALKKLLLDKEERFYLSELSEKLEKTEKNYNLNLKMTKDEYIEELVIILEENKEYLSRQVPIITLKRYLDFLDKSTKPSIKKLKEEILKIFITNCLDSQDNKTFKSSKDYVKEVQALYPELEEYIKDYRCEYKLEESIENFLQSMSNNMGISLKQEMIIKSNKEKIKSEIIRSTKSLQNILFIRRHNKNNYCLIEILDELNNNNLYVDKIKYLTSR